MEIKSQSVPVRLLQGAILIGIAYILTYAASTRVFGGPQSGLSWEMGLPMAILLAVVPYLVGGLYCRYVGLGRSRYFPLWIGLLAVSVERLFILSVGYLFFASGGDGSMEGVSFMMFIQGEAAPYFTWSYITLGSVMSIAILWVTSSLPRVALTR